MGSDVWCDIAAATKLTSVSLSHVSSPGAEQADAVSALAALSDLLQLTWDIVKFHGVKGLFASLLLQQMTQLTYLDLQELPLDGLQSLSSLTKLQYLCISGDRDWVNADCPGLQELKALTGLHLSDTNDVPATVIQLTALQQLYLRAAPYSAINGLQVLSALTKLQVWNLGEEWEEVQSLQLQLTGLQHLELGPLWDEPLPFLFLASCKQLRVLSLRDFALTGPDSLVASSMLQHLEIQGCSVAAADGAVPVSWQQVLPGPGPHLTLLQLTGVRPSLQHSDIECMVAACGSRLQVLHLDTLQDSFAPVLARLPALTSLHLGVVTDTVCRPLAQLTGLREVRVERFAQVTSIGARQLAALEQLTSLGFGQGWGNFREDSPLLRKVMLDKLPRSSRAIVNKAPAGCPSDVPSRLLRACDAAAAAQGRSHREGLDTAKTGQPLSG